MARMVPLSLIRSVRVEKLKEAGPYAEVLADLSVTCNADTDDLQWILMKLDALVPADKWVDAYTALGSIPTLKTVGFRGASQMHVPIEQLIAPLTNITSLRLTNFSQAITAAIALLNLPSNNLTHLVMEFTDGLTILSIDEFTRFKKTVLAVSSEVKLRYLCVHQQTYAPALNLTSALVPLLEALPFMPKLKFLSLVGDINVALPPLKTLQSLELESSADIRMHTILSNLHTYPLNVLSISSIEVKDELSALLTRLPRTLRILRLKKAGLSEDRHMSLLESLTKFHLDELDLEGNLIGPTGAQILMKFIAGGWKLRFLGLKRNPIGNATVQALEALMRDSALAVVETQTRELMCKHGALAGSTYDYINVVLQNRALPVFVHLPANVETANWAIAAIDSKRHKRRWENQLRAALKLPLKH